MLVRGRGCHPGAATPVSPTSRPTPAHSLQGAALRAYYLSEDLSDFQLQPLPPAPNAGDAGATEEGGSSGPHEAAPWAWVIRAVPRAQELLHVYPGWPW